MSTLSSKKILYIHHGKGLGGAPLSLLYLIKSLDKTKYHPIVLFLHNSDAIDMYKKESIEIAGPVKRYDFPHTKIWWFRWYHAPYLLRSLYDTIITYLWTAEKWITQLNPDIIHLNTSSLIAWGAVAHNKKIPVVWHIREPLAAGYFGMRRWLIKKCVENFASKIIPICHNDALPWKNHPKITVIHNPVDPIIFDHAIDSTRFSIEGVAGGNGSQTILFLGGVSQEKGTLVILEIFEKLLHILPNAHLLIAGYWNLDQPSAIKALFPANQYKNKIKEAWAKVQRAVTLLGPITNVPEAMAASNVIVFPATVGHFARPIIEAGFMKKPVVASNMPPLEELVIDGQTGYLITPTDITQWTETLYAILTNKKLQQSLGNQAHAFCFQHFALNLYQDKIEPIYDILINTVKNKNL